MNRAFHAATVQGFEAVIPTIVLPDPDDRHVVAAGTWYLCDSKYRLVFLEREKIVDKIVGMYRDNTVRLQSGVRKMVSVKSHD
jgi:hypothetical protein